MFTKNPHKMMVPLPNANMEEESDNDGNVYKDHVNGSNFVENGPDRSATVQETNEDTVVNSDSDGNAYKDYALVQVTAPLEELPEDENGPDHSATVQETNEDMVVDSDRDSDGMHTMIMPWSQSSGQVWIHNNQNISVKAKNQWMDTTKRTPGPN